jgi:hypothetical protein
MTFEDNVTLKCDQWSNSKSTRKDSNAHFAILYNYILLCHIWPALHFIFDFICGCKANKLAMYQINPIMPYQLYIYLPTTHYILLVINSILIVRKYGCEIFSSVMELKHVALKAMATPVATHIGTLTKSSYFSGIYFSSFTISQSVRYHEMFSADTHVNINVAISVSCCLILSILDNVVIQVKWNTKYV